MIFAWDIGSSVTYAECEKLAELAEGKLVLEVGSWLGRSTIALASVATKVIAVDWHHGDFYAGVQDTEQEFRANLARYGICTELVAEQGCVGSAEVVVAKIEEVWQTIPPGFDVVFIDADHSEESAAEHYRIAHELVKPDGVIVFHDYGRFGVTAALDAVAEVETAADSLAIIRLHADS
jgi:predicted O-methyltransferase YrrM